MMGHREKLKTPLEWDLTGRWRKHRILSNRAGKWKRVKIKLNRRVRRISRTRTNYESLRGNYFM